MSAKSYMFALVHFYQESKFSVVNVNSIAKEADIPLNFSTWDVKKSVEVKWREELYPARILQFGGNYYTLFCYLSSTKLVNCI